MVFEALNILLIAVFAGALGSLLGLGGGIIITPALTLLFGYDIKYAVGASIISVIATSSGSAVSYVRDRITNLRVGMFLEIATTAGAITGALISGLVAPGIIYMIFGLVLFYSAVAMLKKNGRQLHEEAAMSPAAEKLQLCGQYYDAAAGKTIEYKVDRVGGGFSMMYGAGILSGLLGIGSGAFKVMAMDLIMKMPLKVSSATSNFMMGVTAAASATIYFFKGDIDPRIAAPVAVGVLIGSNIGSKAMQKLKSKTIRKIFVPVIMFVAIQMIYKGFVLK